MGRLAWHFILTLSAFAFATGCTVATPEATSMLSNLNNFKLTNHDLRIDDTGDLSSISVTASCSSLNTSFEYELTDSTPGTWNPIPATASGIFTSMNEQCSASNSLSFTLDLSTTPPFSTMVLGNTYRITFRDINMFGLSQTEEFRITYSQFSLTDSRLINGQGLNNTKTSGAYTLQGKVIHTPQLPIVNSASNTYTLQGKVVFE